MNLEKFVACLNFQEREKLLALLTFKPLNIEDEIAYYWFKKYNANIPTILRNSVVTFLKNEPDLQYFTVGEFLKKGYLKRIRNIGKGSITKFFDNFPELEKFREFNIKT